MIKIEYDQDMMVFRDRTHPDHELGRLQTEVFESAVESTQKLTSEAHPEVSTLIYLTPDWVLVIDGHWHSGMMYTVLERRAHPRYVVDCFSLSPRR